MTKNIQEEWEQTVATGGGHLHIYLPTLPQPPCWNDNTVWLKAWIINVKHKQTYFFGEGGSSVRTSKETARRFEVVAGEKKKKEDVREYFKGMIRKLIKGPRKKGGT